MNYPADEELERLMARLEKLSERSRDDGSPGGGEDGQPRDPTSPQGKPTYWDSLLARVEQAVAEVNRDAGVVRRVLGGEGLRVSAAGDTLEVTRAAPPLMHLRVTNHGQSVSAEWVTQNSAGREGDGDGRRRALLDYEAHPTSGLVLRKESGAGMVLDEAVRYLLTPLLMPPP